MGWYADRKQWKKLNAFGMLHKTFMKGVNTEKEYRYYICGIGEDEEDMDVFKWRCIKCFVILILN